MNAKPYTLDELTQLLKKLERPDCIGPEESTEITARLEASKSAEVRQFDRWIHRGATHPEELEDLVAEVRQSGNPGAFAAIDWLRWFKDLRDAGKPFQAMRSEK